MLCPPTAGCVFAHFALRNTRSTDAEVRSSDDGDAHTSVGISSANFGEGFLQLLGEPGKYEFLQQDSKDSGFLFFAEETISCLDIHHKRRKDVPTLLGANLKKFLLLAFMSAVLTLWPDTSMPVELVASTSVPSIDATNLASSTDRDSELHRIFILGRLYTFQSDSLNAKGLRRLEFLISIIDAQRAFAD